MSKVLTGPRLYPKSSLDSRKTVTNGLATYFHLVWLDYLSITISALLMAGVYYTPMYSFENRYLQVWPSIDNNSGLETFHGPLKFSYSALSEPVSSINCALLAIFVPIIVIATFQIRIWSFWDFHAGALGSLKGVISATFVCTVLKHFIGGFRPNYLDTCKPDTSRVVMDMEHHTHWFNPTACTDTRLINRSLQAFPSGHAGSMFAAGAFLTLYLNAKLKVFSDFGPHFWTLMVTVTPLLAASLLSGSMYITHHHHTHDIIFGMLIGAIFGGLAFRTSYASMFDFRYNHIPLPPFGAKTRFLYTEDSVLGEISLRIRKSECDKLVVWKWWRLHGSRRIEQEKEMVWLQSMMSWRATGQNLSNAWKDNGRKRMMSASHTGIFRRPGLERSVSLA
jgi:diacylglycerol diphosphate phosphatase/phosphatidate phosphatase